MTKEEYPNIIYKYRNWTDKHNKNVFLKNQLFLSSPKTFNDPFDCRIPENFYLLDTQEKIENYVTLFRNSTHLEAMKQSKKFSSKIQSHRIQKEDLLIWKEAKNLFDKN